jgi:ABC-type iron transport system FetAB ATPase subunit
LTELTSQEHLLRTPLLELDALDCRVLSPVDLVVSHGECVGVSGPSGCGKTRLLRAVADLDPHDGECYLEGEACRGMPAHRWRSRVGLLTADSRWWAGTVGEHFPTADARTLERLGFDRDVMDA